MRIAVLVHSAVTNDARITKQAMSLRAAGHEVVIHGIAPGRDRIVTILPASDVRVLLKPRIGASRATAQARPDVALAGARRWTDAMEWAVTGAMRVRGKETPVPS